MPDYQGENFKKFLEKNKIKKIDAAKRLGIVRSALYDYFNSKNMSRETVQKITSAFGVKEWDIWGTGDLVSDISNSLTVEMKMREFIDAGIANGRIVVRSDEALILDQDTIDQMQEEAGRYAEKLAYETIKKLIEEKKNASNVRLFTNVGNRNMYVVPLKAQGGFLSGYENTVFLERLERASFPFVKGECFAFEVDGFSMYKDYVPGDFVVTTVVENFEWLSKGKVYVFQTVNGLILKCFDRIEGDYIHLYSLNEEYNPVEPIHLREVKKVYFKEKVIKN